jgi:hypothetical protein
MEKHRCNRIPRLINNLKNNDNNNTGVYGGEISLRAYSSYYCCDFHTTIEDDYKRHVAAKHPKHTGFPNKADIEKRGLKPQGKDWER